MPVLSVLRSHETAIVPTFKCESHYTLYTIEDTHIHPNRPVLIKTGIKLAFPKSYCALIVGNGRITTLGGLIDSDYRGDVNVIATSTSEVHITRGEAIASMFVLEIALPDIKISERLNNCEVEEEIAPSVEN